MRSRARCDAWKVGVGIGVGIGIRIFALLVDSDCAFDPDSNSDSDPDIARNFTSIFGYPLLRLVSFVPFLLGHDSLDLSFGSQAFEIFLGTFLL